MIIGVFGGAGSGKSEYLNLMKTKYRAKVYQLDKIVHDLYKKSNAGYKAIKRTVKSDIFTVDGEIDRIKLANVLFNNPALLTKVNAAVHPIAWAKAFDLAENYQKKHPRALILLEAALLPSKKYEIFDKTVYVYSTFENRRNRLNTYRNYSDEKIDSIFSSQPNDDDYRKFCDIVIDNNKTIEEMKCDF